MLNHDPSLEWPGPDIPASRTHSPTPDDPSLRGPTHHVARASWVTMRLLVTESSILPRRHRIAVVDGYHEIQFGRDVSPPGSNTPRIRLKEMEVSKFHATAFWDAERREWAVVDMGSKHGTYLKSPESGLNTGPGIRLSATKMASVPRRIRHLDLLTIGSTTFQVHIHDDHVPCVECSPRGGDEIPLSSMDRVRDENPSLKRSLDIAGMEDNATRPRDPKKALTMLRQALLTRHDDGRQSTDSRTRYADRSAARRVRQSSSYHDAPGVPIQRRDSSSNSPSPAPVPSSSNEAVTTISAPPTPIPETNIGHQLLVKQGWQPGTALGVPEVIGENSSGLLEPLDIDANRDRAGLGTVRDPPRSTNWRELARQKRWDDAR